MTDSDGSEAECLWSIAEVARMSKVSSRTLRHYQQIGLLDPAGTASNGYRYYGRSQVRRLQRILLLREVGLPLATIRNVLAGQTSELAALHTHHDWLLAERDRMATMAGTVRATISALQRGETMNAEELFVGFEENPYEEEASSRWGKETVARSTARYAALTLEQKQAMAAESTAINVELSGCSGAGFPADHPEVQAAIHRHYRWVCFHWTPDAARYVGLGQMYVDDPRFAANYEKADVPAHYVLEAIRVYAEANL